jgi:hypothetical protein
MKGSRTRGLPAAPYHLRGRRGESVTVVVDQKSPLHAVVTRSRPPLYAIVKRRPSTRLVRLKKKKRRKLARLAARFSAD